MLDAYDDLLTIDELCEVLQIGRLGKILENSVQERPAAFLRPAFLIKTKFL